MLHGMAQSAHTWDFAALALSDRYRVLALDQRGHGDSDWAPDGDYSLDAHLGDITSFVEAMDLGGLVMVGCRWAAGTRSRSPPCTRSW